MTPDLGLADSLVTAMVVLATIGTVMALGVRIAERCQAARQPLDRDGAPLFRPRDGAR